MTLLQHLKNVMQLSSELQFQRRDGSFELVFSFRHVLSLWLLSKLFFVFSFQINFGVSVSAWIWGFILSNVL